MSKKSLNVLNLKSILKKSKKISEIYSSFKFRLEKTIKKKTFVVGVSGGPDSLALAALSKMYQHEHRVKVFFVLIDHAIRRNSKNEASFVKKLLRKKGINITIIRNKERIEKNVQNKARKVRYGLLSEYCERKKARFILTGHHSDDQIETFLIRLSRGSGIQGLSSMNKITKLNSKVSLIRPLLDFKKKDLAFIARKVFGKFIIDPSNKDTKYLRTKVRSLKKELEKSGIHHDKIMRSINNLASTRDTLNNYLERIIESCVEKRRNETLINLKKLFLESNEIKFKILSSAIKDFSKSYYPPRSKKVFNALKQFNSDKKIKLTLGGCFLEKSGDYLSIRKEV
tara:strand:+ start:1318 stop:2340 length:1023 start_codon:yes stop_codon:yes gene_type:complete